MKKVLIFFSVCIVYIISTRVVVAETIHNFSTDIQIKKDGTIRVQEVIEYDFESSFRHGIYRYIPFIKVNSEGKKFKFDFSQISVTDEAGNSQTFTSSTSGQDIVLKIGDANRTITGLHTYVVKYDVAGALTYFSDHDELYWNATGNEWNAAIEKARATILLPEYIDGAHLKLACYTGASGSAATDCSFHSNGNKAIFTSDQSLATHQGMSIVVGFPKNIIAVIEPKPYVPFGETWYGRVLNSVFMLALGIGAILWYLIYPIWIIVKWWRFGRDPKPEIGETRAWYDPPKTSAGRSLVPAETGGLIDERIDSQDISATLVNLAQRGYFKIEERKKKDFYFIKKKEPDGALLQFEKKLLNAFFDGEGEIRLKDAQVYAEMEEVKKLLYENLVSEGFFPKNPNSIRNFYYGIGAVALFTFNIPLVIIAFIFGTIMPRKTQFGSDQAQVAKSLKNFLSSQERQLEFQAKNQMMFEKLLPFAIAFGVEKIWADRFKDIAMKQPSWYSGYDSTHFNSVYLASSLHSSFNQNVSSAVTPTRSSSGFSSGFSGGFSGGGGGGGGGGSW